MSAFRDRSCEDAVDGGSKLCLSDIENIFDECFNLFDVRHVVRCMTEEKLRHNHVTFARHFREIPEGNQP